MLQPIFTVTTLTAEQISAALNNIAGQLKQIHKLYVRIAKLENKIDQRDIRIGYLEQRCNALEQERQRTLQELMSNRNIPNSNINLR